MMLGWKSADRSRNRIPEDLYAAIVAQARAPDLYARLGVPDTVAGRFEMVVLHTAMALRRLEGGTDVERRLARAVFDRFCADMDASLREFGVSDVAMGKRMKAMARGYFGRAGAYGAVLSAGDPDDVLAVLQRNLFPKRDGTADRRLADYAVRVSEVWCGVPAGVLEAGAPALPPVEVWPG